MLRVRADCVRVPHPFAGRRQVLLPALPLDLHVLSLPLAFILSQDQTLHCKWIVQNWLMFSNVNFSEIRRFNYYVSLTYLQDRTSSVHAVAFLLFPNLSKNLSAVADTCKCRGLEPPAGLEPCIFFVTYLRTSCYPFVTPFSQTECKGRSNFSFRKICFKIIFLTTLKPSRFFSKSLRTTPSFFAWGTQR